MPQITIQEGLTRKKTIFKRIEGLMLSCGGEAIAREAQKRDPYLSVGGSAEFIQRRKQAIKDLFENYLTIVTQIQKVNLEVAFTIEGETYSVAAWLEWKRHIHGKLANFAAAQANAVKQVRDRCSREGRAVIKSATEEQAPTDAIVNVNEADLAKELDRLTKMLGTLEGLLSLNACTTKIEIQDDVEAT